MNHWVAFAGIIAAQGVVLALVERLGRALRPNQRYEHKSWEVLAAGLIGGLALGLAFDQLIGQRFGFFQYYLESPWFRIANATLSYGLAVATALQLSPKPTPVDSERAARSLGVLLLACATCIGAATFLPNPFIFAGAVGGTIIAIGEVLELWVLGNAGPVVEAISGYYSRALGNWIAVVLVGSVYELANTAFPVWRWSIESSPPSFLTELTIVVFGYVVLLHASRTIGLVVLRLVRRIYLMN